MLRLSIRPGEYLTIGDNVKVIFTGGSDRNLKIMVDAPKEVAVVRSKAAEKAGEAGPSPYYPDPVWKPKDPCVKAVRGMKSPMAAQGKANA